MQIYVLYNLQSEKLSSKVIFFPILKNDDFNIIFIGCCILSFWKRKWWHWESAVGGNEVKEVYFFFLWLILPNAIAFYVMWCDNHFNLFIYKVINWNLFSYLCGFGKKKSIAIKA